MMKRESGSIGPLDVNDTAALRAIEEIFFASAPPEHLKTAEERRTFLHRWTSYYLREERDQVLLFRLEDGTVAGYLMGCMNSREALPLYDLVGHYGLFEHHFERFPGHFHINCHPANRSKGIGSALVQRFVAVCRTAQLPGIHVVTAAGSRNVRFYRRLEFEAVEERQASGLPRLLLGLRLT